MSGALACMGRHTGTALVSSIISATGGALIGTLTSCAAMLGRELMLAGGTQAADFSFGDVVVPTLIGSSIVLGGLGFMYGAISGEVVNCHW